MIRKIRWGAVAALVTSVVGVISHPQVLALLPEKVATTITIVGIAWQAVTNAIHKPNE